MDLYRISEWGGETIRFGPAWICTYCDLEYAMYPFMLPDPTMRRHTTPAGHGSLSFAPESWYPKKKKVKKLITVLIMGAPEKAGGCCTDSLNW